MTFHNPHRSTQHEVQYQAHKERDKKQRTRGRMKSAAEYLKSEHRYRLVIGKDKTGIERTMTGREAKTANDLSVLKFGSGKVKKISRWCLIKEDGEKCERT